MIDKTAGKIRAARSALDGLQPFKWSLTDSVNFEIALDTIGYVIGLLTALIDREEKHHLPNAEAIARWEDSITDAVREQQSLRAVDAGAIAEVTTRYRELRAQLDKQFDAQGSLTGDPDKKWWSDHESRPRHP